MHLYLLSAADPLCAEIDAVRCTFFDVVFAGFAAEEIARIQALKDRIVDNTIRARKELKTNGGQ